VSDARGGEVWFYHLERSTLDQVLPDLLDRSLQRGWRARVRVTDPDQRREIDERLWAWREDSFLAHGLAEEPEAERQPILLTGDQENRNGSQALFIVDGSDMSLKEEFERCFIIFDGRDETALMTARIRWKALKDQGANLAYWKQSDAGRWEKAA
jgi:DNA polymerase-3 subunit chi